MYENGIDVVYEAASYDDQGHESWGPHQRVTLPGWCAGEPDAALALYLFGRVDNRSEVNVIDWQPRDDEGGVLVDEDECRHMARTTVPVCADCGKRVAR